MHAVFPADRASPIPARNTCSTNREAPIQDAAGYSRGSSQLPDGPAEHLCQDDAEGSPAPVPSHARGCGSTRRRGCEPRRRSASLSTPSRLHGLPRPRPLRVAMRTSPRCRQIERVRQRCAPPTSVRRVRYALVERSRTRRVVDARTGPSRPARCGIRRIAPARLSRPRQRDSDSGQIDLGIDVFASDSSSHGARLLLEQRRIREQRRNPFIRWVWIGLAAAALCVAAVLLGTWLFSGSSPSPSPSRDPNPGRPVLRPRT